MTEAADALYGLPPDRFTAARDARVRAAREAGDRPLAEAVAGLRRPSLSAWANNMLVREHPEQVRPLLDLGEELRRAHRELDGARLRELADSQRELLGALAQEAREVAARAGHPVSESVGREVADTLRAVLADPEASRAWASGRLTKAPGATSGFDAVAPDALPPGPSGAARRGGGGGGRDSAGGEGGGHGRGPSRKSPARSGAKAAQPAREADAAQPAEAARPAKAARAARDAQRDRKQRELAAQARRDLRAAERAYEERAEESQEARRLAEEAEARRAELAEQAEALVTELKRTRTELRTAREEERAARARAQEREKRAREGGRKLSEARRTAEAAAARTPTRRRKD
ncbi:hypothetical protein HUT18_28455 [Streptomyces sp. NA04227]|nr:hypothetical protein HUT18_28455 [Streptomyces sp. NA04227]